MNYSEKNIYKAEIKYQYLQKRMLIALQFNNKEGFDVFYAKLPLDRKNIKNRVMKILIHFPFGFVFYKVLSKFWKND